MLETLPRREREVFETLCRLGEATGATIRKALGDDSADSTVRTLLSRLQRRGMVVRSSDRPTLYRPAPEMRPVAERAMRDLIKTFFAGSAASAATALLGMSEPLSAADRAALLAAIDAMEDDRP